MITDDTKHNNAGQRFSAHQYKSAQFAIRQSHHSVMPCDSPTNIPFRYRRVPSPDHMRQDVHHPLECSWGAFPAPAAKRAGP